MMKTKGKIILTLLLTLIVGVLFATMVYAAPSDIISIEFYTTGNAIDKSINTNVIIEGVADIHRGETVMLPSKAVSAGSSFNWYTEDGRAWEGGTTVTFYESAKLFPITTIDVYTYEELDKLVSADGCKVRIMNDLELPKKLGFAGGGTGYESFFLLNGHKITVASSVSTAWGGSRHGSHFYGTGTIEYLGSGTFIDLYNHAWGGDHCRLFVGSGVTINAPNSVLSRDGNDWNISGFPRIQIYGIVNCKTVLQMSHSTNRYPRVEIYDGAQLNISGPFLRHTVTGNNINVNIYGGNITTTSTTESFFDDIERNGAVFTISGGSFTFANAADYDMLNQTIDEAIYEVIELTGSNGVTYKTVVSFTPCEHEYELNNTQAANCNHATYDNFYCTKVSCESHIRISYGTVGEHSFPSTPSQHKDPTKTVPGWDKYFCEDCSCVKYEYIYYNPVNDEITIIVNVGGTEQSVSAKVNEVFDVLQDEATQKYTVKAVKAFGSYTADQIVGIYIPAGISEVKITVLNPNASVKTITFGEGADVTVTSLKGLTNLENIVIENTSNLVFEKECAPKTIKSIRSDVTGAKVEYKEAAFIGQSTLEVMTFSKGSVYIFGKQSFKESGVKSLDFVDGCSVNFSGEQAFYASKVEYLYVGKGISTIANKPFDCAYYLQKIILMDVTNLSTDYTFCCMNKGAKPCVVYHHADTLSLGANTFYQSHGVTLYTNASITQGFNSCSSTAKNGVTYPSYTIHYGITHAYERIDTDSTCTEAGSIRYVTDCPCGQTKGTSYKMFVSNLTNSSSYTEIDCTDKEKELLPHTLQSFGTIEYCDGYTRPGYFTYRCTMCRNGIKEGNATFPPLVVCYGYSVNESNGKGALSVKYCINVEALRAYEESNSLTLEYGSVIALRKSLGENTPLDESGNPRGGVAKLNGAIDEFSTNLIKLTGLGEAQKSLNFVMSFYIIDGGEVFYVQDTETVENPSGVSYKEVKELADYYESLLIALPVSVGDDE